MQRLRIFATGLVLLTNSETGKVIDQFHVSDTDKAQEIVMKWLKERNEREKANGRS